MLGVFQLFVEGVVKGGVQVYIEYCGDIGICEGLVDWLVVFIGVVVDVCDGLIVMFGMQGVLFLVVVVIVVWGDKVVIVWFDYFVNCKLVEFFEGEIIFVVLFYDMVVVGEVGLDLLGFEVVFKVGVWVFLFLNLNNLVGVVYLVDEIVWIVWLVVCYDVMVIVDQLYLWLLFFGVSYMYLCVEVDLFVNVVIIMGLFKMELFSGYWLGVVFGVLQIIV